MPSARKKLAPIALEYPSRYGKTYRADISKLNLTCADGRNLADLAQGFLACANFYTIRNRIRALQLLGNALHALAIKKLPANDEQWTLLIEKCLEWTITNSTSTANLKSRVHYWNKGVEPLLRYLRDEHGLLPVGIFLPRVPYAVVQGEDVHGRTLADKEEHTHYPATCKLLLDIDLSIGGADFLQIYADRLLMRRSIVRECLLRHWTFVKECFLFGREVAREENIKSLLNLYLRGMRRVPWIKGGPHILNGGTEESLGLLLYLLRTRHGSMFEKKLVENSEGLPSLSVIRFPSSAPTPFSPHLRKTQIVNYMLGNLGASEVASFCALLLMENPVFTPQAIVDAQIENERGHSMLKVGECGYSFTVLKARATSYKTSNLSEISREIISGVLEMTRFHREELRRTASPVSKTLFIQAQSGRPREPAYRTCAAALTNSGEREISLVDHFPELQQMGFGPSLPISFSRIRNTEGVLEYFKTGSIKAVARRLGNTTGTVLIHYIPPWLIELWNARQIRRYQNLEICVAWGTPEGLLEKTDFKDAVGLHKFLCEILAEHRACDSPLGKELHKRFGELLDENQEADLNGKTLMISVSPDSLRLLYAYERQLVLSNPGQANLRKKFAGISPEAFLNLARFLRGTLPTHRENNLRRAHDLATTGIGLSLENNLKIVIDNSSRFTKIDDASAI